MYISIADSREETKTSESGDVSKFVVYNIHINGTYHCSARFSKLHELYETLKREFGAGLLGEFPRKTIFYMRPEESAQRRKLLEKFLQNIARNPHIVKGSTFQNFLLNAQSEVQRDPEENVQLEVYLPNGKSLTVDILSTNQTDDVLETVCSVLEMSPDLTYYFALYLVEDMTGRNVLRRLQDFECPYVSIQRADSENRIQLRRAYWDAQCEITIMQNPISLNLLYVQAINDIKSGALVVDPRVADELAVSRTHGDKVRFLTIARDLPGYCYESFGQAITSYPEEGTKCFMFIGRGEILCIDDLAHREYRFRVDRIRSWRTYTNEEEVELEIEFHLEHTTDKMRWIQFRVRNCIHAAMCLQFMVEETIRIRDRTPLRRPVDRVGKFKPQKQTVRARDMAFLTSEAPSGRSSESLSPSHTAVSFSGLIARIGPQGEESHSNAAGLAGLSTSFQEDEDDDDADVVTSYGAVPNPSTPASNAS